MLEDVYFGDLWLASGQSNMELPMARVQVKYPEAVARATYPQIRFFRAPKEADFDRPRFDFSAGQWRAVTPESVRDMSAVAFFFAQQIQAHQSIPIGFIDNSYGGSAVESWMSEQALKAFPEHLEQARRYRDAAYLASLKEADAKKNQAWAAGVDAGDQGLRAEPRWFDGDVPEALWKSVEMPGLWQDRGVIAGNGVVWFRRDVTLPAAAARQWTNRLGTMILLAAAFGAAAGVAGALWSVAVSRMPTGPAIVLALTAIVALSLTLRAGVLPPTINVSRPHPEYGLEGSPLYLNTETSPWLRATPDQPRRAGVSSFGFGGTNFHVVLEEHQSEQDRPYRLQAVARSFLMVGIPSTRTSGVSDLISRVSLINVAEIQDLPAPVAAGNN